MLHFDGRDYSGVRPFSDFVVRPDDDVRTFPGLSRRGKTVRDILRRFKTDFDRVLILEIF